MSYAAIGENHTLVKSFVAGGTITERNMITLDASGNVVEATGVTSPIIGASIGGVGGAGASGADIDVVCGGIVAVIAGAAINEGDPVTAGAGGKAAAAAPAAGVNNYILGFALTAAAADGDWVFVLISPGRIQG